MAINSPKNDFAEKHRFLTYADEPDTVYDGSKIMDGSVTTDKLANYAVTTDKIDDESITTVKLDDEIVTVSKLASDVVNAINDFPDVGNGLQLANDMLSAKLGAGMAFDGNGAISLSGGNIDGAVSDWLDDHPEATTTVQDGAITAPKIADENVTLSKLNSNVFGTTNYKIYTIGNALSTNNMFIFLFASVDTPTNVKISFDINKHYVNQWCTLRARIYQNTTSDSKTVTAIDSSTPPTNVSKHYDVEFTSDDITITKLTSVAFFFDRPIAREYDIDIFNVKITVNGYEVVPTGVGTYVDGTKANWLTVTEPEISYVATKKYVQESYGQPKQSIEVTDHLLQRFYNVFDDSSKHKTFGYNIFTDYLATPDKSKDIYFNSKSDRLNIISNVSQVNDVETTTEHVSFYSDAYNVDNCDISLISTKSSVANTLKNVLVIGDSVTSGTGAGSEYGPYQRRFAFLVKEEDIDFSRNSNLLMVGTIGATYTLDYEGQQYQVPVHHEGRSGWSLKDYYSNKTFEQGNPFYDGSLAGECKFSLSKYLERYRTIANDGTRLNIGDPLLGTEITASNINTIDVATPDVIVINLGHNDFYITTTVDQFYNMMLDVAGSIRTDFPNAYIVICSTIPLSYCVHQDFYPNYATVPITNISYRYKYYDITAKWKAFIEANTDSHIQIMPLYNVTPTVDSFKWEVANNETVKSIYYTKNEYGSAHPYSPAHTVFAHQMYGIYKYLQTL